MSDVSQLELEHCKELAMPPGSLFEFTSRYIPTGRQQQLTALYALIQSVGSIPGASTDDSVKWSKLKWWSEELLAEPSAASRHPVLRALWQSGARQQLDDVLLLQLISNALTQIDALPDAHEESMFERLATKGETGVLLELALDGVEIESQALQSLAAASGLFAMISGFSIDRRAENLHLPLNLLAKHQLTEAQFEQDPPRAELVDAISQLAGSGLEWFSQGLPVLGASACMHLRLRWAMEVRLLSRFSQNAGAILGSGNRFGPSDAWFAWRYCRKLERS